MDILDHQDKRTAKPREGTPRAPRGAFDGSRDLASTLGNAAVQRLMRSTQGGNLAGSTVDDAIARTIQAKRGGGQALDTSARDTLEPALGQDFSDVRVHTDGEADSLTHAVQAEAFTTGSDIFFRQGAYTPGSAGGRKLLAHELTHVVQQRGSPASQEMRISSPDDPAEQQASHVADGISGASSASLARQEAPEEDELQKSPLAREEMQEEEVQSSPLARQEMPEEDVQTSSVARQETSEEEAAGTPG